jgi:hypothetical protein
MIHIPACIRAADVPPLTRVPSLTSPPLDDVPISSRILAADALPFPCSMPLSPRQIRDEERGRRRREEGTKMKEVKARESRVIKWTTSRTLKKTISGQPIWLSPWTDLVWRG